MAYEVLNKKEEKKILRALEEQFCFKGTLPYVFMKNQDNRLYIANRDAFNIDLSKLRVNLKILFI